MKFFFSAPGLNNSNKSSSKLLMLLSLLLSSNSAKSMNDYDKIADYAPMTLVTDILNIDLDQERMEEQLAAPTGASLTQAQRYYSEGGHSKSVATVALTLPLSVSIRKGESITGEDAYNHEITGTAYLDANIGDDALHIEYTQGSFSNPDRLCQVGARPVGDQMVNGCFRRQGTLRIGVYDLAATATILSYAYDPYVDNDNGRTLRRFSLLARTTMYDCKDCPFLDFLKFREYYGKTAYADEWVMAAFAGTKTDFTHGSADFGSYALDGRAQAIKKGTAYMAVWMMVIGKLETALSTCRVCAASGSTDCNNDDTAVQNWDEAVALYTGSLEGTEGSSGKGVFPYALADKRCIDFHTCGQNRDNDVGISAINLELFEFFRAGQIEVFKNECQTAQKHKERIVELMTVPLVQGVLKYAYIVDRQTDVTDKERAEGATFAAAVLPMVHFCNKDDAEIIENHMSVGSKQTDYAEVRKALTNNYQCLGITCQDVGGMFDEMTRDYFTDAEPCKIKFTAATTSAAAKDNGSPTPAIVVGVIGGLLLGIIVYMSYRRSVRERMHAQPARLPTPSEQKGQHQQVYMEDTVSRVAETTNGSFKNLV